MDSKQWEKVKEVFSAALDLPSDERSGFLENTDAEVRTEVEKLLANYESAKDFIDEPAVIEFGFDDSKDSFIGKKIDDYLVLKEIGAGGMGAVYLAEQQSENLSHRVALKLIKRGMDTNSVLKRFVMERQILANLEHPNIARFTDGGSTDDGVPYFVMEYVEGLPLKKYCETQNLDTKARLELFRKICAAVSFAHQNLIVHRDLKPSNILVTETGEPKLLDFGIAKLLHPEWSLDTQEATATMFRIMTPEYASPEQLKGETVTTASDVYSLGVVLYELLTGMRPFKLENRSPEEAARVVLTEEPVKPSSVGGGVERQRPVVGNNPDENGAKKTKGETLKTNPKSKIQNPKSLKGDLDNIILKSLRKEPARRYQSVQEFSEDIRRHLEGLPVTAVADTVSYRTAKFVKRHKAGVLATVLIGLTLLTATAVTAWQSVQIRHERDKAEQRFRQVRKLANLVVFEYHDGIEKLAGSTAIREKMVKDALEYLDSLSLENETDMKLKSELAAAYQKIGDVQGNPYLPNLGNQDGALESYRKSLAITTNLFDSNPNDVQTRLNLEMIHTKIGDVLWAKGITLESRENYLKALEICEKLAAENNLSVENQYSFVRLYGRIAQTQEQSGDFPGALENNRLMLAKAENLLNIEPENKKYRRAIAIGYGKIGDIFHLTKQFREASEYFQKAVVIFEEIANVDKSNATSKRELTLFVARVGASQIELGEHENGLETSRRAIVLQQEISSADPNNFQIHFDMADVYMNSVDALGRMKRYVEAEETFRKAVSIYEKYLAENPDYLQARSHYGEAHLVFAKIMSGKGEAAKSLEIYRKSLAILTNVSPSAQQPDKIAETYEGIGDALVALKSNSSEAQEMYQKSLEIWQKLKESGKLKGEDVDRPEKISQKIANFTKKI